MKRFYFVIYLLLCITTIVAQSFGQSLLKGIADGFQTGTKNAPYDRSVLRNSISEWSSCMNGSLTCNHGAVAYYGKNGYVYTMSVPPNLSAKIKEVYNAGGTFTDINITDGGFYVLVWNQKQWYGHLPQRLLDKLRSLPNETTFYSISFNDSGEYIIVTSDHFYSSSTLYTNFFNAKKSELGNLYSANIWQSGAVFCFEKGSTFCGVVPSNVVEAMNSCGIAPRFVKYNQRGDYLICSTNGDCWYKISDVDKSVNAATTSYYLPSQSSSSPSGISPTIGTVCYNCGGAGFNICTTCNGGKKRTIYYAGGQALVTCNVCAGTGRIPCQVCYGKGIIYK